MSLCMCRCYAHFHYYFGLGARKASRSISSLTCAVLRKCLPSLPLPLSTLKSPIHFPLPVDQVATDNASASASSSTKTTVSDLLTHINEKGEEHNVEEGDEDTPTLKSPVFASLRLAGYLKQAIPSDSDISDGDARASNRFAVCAPVEKSVHTPEQHSYNTAELNSDDLLNKLSSFTDCIAKIDLDSFTKFFPELNDSNERLSSFHFLPLMPTSISQPSTCNPWLDDSDLEAKVTKPPVIVPTAIPTSEKNTDILSGSKEEKEEEKSNMKTAAKFTEEPAPQVLGHVPSEKPELVYSKGISVDR